MTTRLRTIHHWLRTGLVVPVLVGLALVTGGAAAAAAVAPAGTGNPVITIRNFAYEGDLTVLAGATVTVRNADAAPHTLTAVDGSFTTKVIQPGKSAKFKAPTKAGNFAITCTIHPRMSGTLTVGVKPPKRPVITIQGFAYTGDLTVRPGARVTVRNADMAPHTLTAVDGSFTTIVIPPGGSATFRAPRALGAYAITCTVHPRMSGTLTVARIVAPQPPPAGPVITIKGFAFQGDLTVPPGAKVTVRNEDTATHDLASVDGRFATPAIPGGTSATFTAPTTPGDYPFVCTFHRSMTGTLTVAHH